MNWLKFIFLVTALVLISSNPGESQIYKWKDEKGKLHFTDDASKVPENNRPQTRATSPQPETRQPIESTQEERYYYGDPTSSHSFDNNMERGMEEGFQEMGKSMAEGLEKGMQKMGEEMGKAFEGMGELMIVAEQNKPDLDKKDFANKEEEAKHEIQQVLLGMFMMCQMQFIMKKSETCSQNALNGKSEDGWKVDENSDMKKKMDDYDFEIDPKKNTRKNLLIKAQHKKSKITWEITHGGRKSLKESSGKTHKANSK